MSEELGKKEMLKDLIKALHAGESPDELKQRFKDVLKDVDPAQIAQVEEELIAEGMPRDEIQRLCDIHLAVGSRLQHPQDIRSIFSCKSTTCFYSLPRS